MYARAFLRHGSYATARLCHSVLSAPGPPGPITRPVPGEEGLLGQGPGL